MPDGNPDKKAPKDEFYTYPADSDGEPQGILIIDDAAFIRSECKDIGVENGNAVYAPESIADIERFIDALANGTATVDYVLCDFDLDSFSDHEEGINGDTIVQMLVNAGVPKNRILSISGNKIHPHVSPNFVVGKDFEKLESFLENPDRYIDSLEQ